MNYDLKGKSPVIPIGSLVLVTGINGYIGSHVADQLLQSGYRVRGTVRSDSKGEWVKELFDKKYGEGKVEIVIVANMSQPGAFDSACEGVSGIAHLASDVTLSPNPNQVIPTVIAGAVNAASAAAKNKDVKRFVYTSSSTAITEPRINVDYSVTIDQWNEDSVKKAWAPPPYTEERSFNVYAASKTQAEQELWTFVEKERPGFVLNTVLPNFNMGSILSDQQSASTGALVKSLYETGELGFWGSFPPQWMVNVRDTARLHVAALIDPEVEGQRILAYAESFNNNDVLGVMRRLYPEKKIPDDEEGLGRDLSRLDNKPGEELLKKFGREGWTNLEESVRDNVPV